MLCLSVLFIVVDQECKKLLLLPGYCLTIHKNASIHKNTFKKQNIKLPRLRMRTNTREHEKVLRISGWSKEIRVWSMNSLILHSHQNLSCLKSGVDYS